MYSLTLPRVLTVLLLAVGACASSLTAQTTPYHLFNPVPAAEMGEMNTDRPDTTESPFTVPAGHFQMEISMFDMARDLDEGVRTETWIYGQANLKVGLLRNVDLQFIMDSYTHVRTADGGDVTDKTSGFGDLTLRLKTNLWGNDGGRTAFGLMPYISIPTYTDVSSEEVQGGLIVPFSVSLTERLSLGMMVQADVVYDAESFGHDIEWVHSASLGISITDSLGTYLELVGIAGEDTAYRALFDCGITYAITDNLMFDAGVRIGLNRAAEDFGVFSGMSVRF